MAMPQPTRSVQRGRTDLAPFRASRPVEPAVSDDLMGSRGVTPSDSCLGPYDYCRVHNPQNPCLSASPIFGYYCSTCCI